MIGIESFLRGKLAWYVGYAVEAKAAFTIAQRILRDTHGGLADSVILSSIEKHIQDADVELELGCQ